MDVGFNVLLSSPSGNKSASDKNTAEICIVNLGRFFAFCNIIVIFNF